MQVDFDGELTNLPPSVRPGLVTFSPSLPRPFSFKIPSREKQAHGIESNAETRLENCGLHSPSTGSGDGCGLRNPDGACTFSIVARDLSTAGA
jgi:hypothetical protein